MLRVYQLLRNTRFTKSLKSRFEFFAWNNCFLGPQQAKWSGMVNKCVRI